MSELSHIGLTIPQAAERLGISRWRVYARINNGELGFVKTPTGAKRIPEAELEDYIRRHTVHARKVAK